MAEPITIDDLDDPRLAALRHLKERPPTDLMVVESEIAVTRLLVSEAVVRCVVVVPSRVARLSPLVRGDFYVCTQALLDSVVGFPMHRGCVAVAERPSSDLNILRDIWSRPRSTVLVAAGVSDPSNIGAIVRSARAFGVDAVICDPKGADVWSRKAVRTSMGNVFSIPVLVEEPSAVLAARPPEVTAIATTISNRAVDLRTYQRPAHVLLMVGNEGDGLRDVLLRAADVTVTIPMAPRADSLNVAAATAVLLYALA